MRGGYRGRLTLGATHSFFEPSIAGNLALAVHVQEGDVSIGDGNPKMATLPHRAALCGKVRSIVLNTYGLKKSLPLRNKGGCIS
jgi:hypothetical protein